MNTRSHRLHLDSEPAVGESKGERKGLKCHSVNSVIFFGQPSDNQQSGNGRYNVKSTLKCPSLSYASAPCNNSRCQRPDDSCIAGARAEHDARWCRFALTH
jgi:hypothetical protein